MKIFSRNKGEVFGYGMCYTIIEMRCIFHTFSLSYINQLVKKRALQYLQRSLFYNEIIYCFTMVLPAIVTAPLLAKALPSSVAPVLKVMDCIARTVPLNTDVVPKVTELPTCQKILDARAPPVRITLRPDVVVSEDAIFIMKTAFEIPFASKVRSPDDTASEEVDL